MHVVVCADAGHYFFPVLAIIIRLPDIGGAVIHLVADRGHIGSAGLMMRSFNDANACIFHHIRWCNVLPGFSIIAGDMNESIIRSGPEGIDLKPGGRQREYGRIDLWAVHVPGDHATAHTEGGRVRVSQVRAYLIPTLSFVG